ncbi:MAG: hypothetical protein ABSG16_01325 [Candidatus Acidiferrum sp.]
MSQRKSHSLARRVLLGGVATAVVLGMALAPGALRHSRQPTVPLHFSVDREIALDVRIGSDKRQVMAYCKRRGWDWQDQGARAVVVDYAAPGTLLVQRDVAITFEFSRAEKLLSFHSEDRYSGP